MKVRFKEMIIFDEFSKAARRKKAKPKPKRKAIRLRYLILLVFLCSVATTIGTIENYKDFVLIGNIIFLVLTVLTIKEFIRLVRK